MMMWDDRCDGGATTAVKERTVKGAGGQRTVDDRIGHHFVPDRPPTNQRTTVDEPNSVSGIFKQIINVTILVFQKKVDKVNTQ